MKSFASLLLAASVLSPVTGMAADGTLGLYAMSVRATGSVDDGLACGASSGEFCGDVRGIGAYAGFQRPVGAGRSVYLDFWAEWHEETHSDKTLRNEEGTYGAFGLHFIDETDADRPWGLFGLLAFGDSNADPASYGPVLGLGGEFEIAGYQVQGGGLFQVGNKDEGVLENLGFVGVGRQYDLGASSLDWGLILGHGDFNTGPGAQEGDWVQVSLNYTRAMGSSGFEIYAGYQFDYIDIPDPSIPNETELHTLKLGISKSFGAGPARFKTPNFRAPLTSAGDLNGN